MREENFIVDATPRTFFIAGVQFRPDYTKFRDLPIEAGSVVDLVGEPSNRYDKYAVKVIFQGTHLGYIPKSISPHFWGLHTLGYKANARILDADWSAPTYEAFKVEVSFIKPTTTSHVKP